MDSGGQYNRRRSAFEAIRPGANLGYSIDLCVQEGSEPLAQAAVAQQLAVLGATGEGERFRLAAQAGAGRVSLRSGSDGVMGMEWEIPYGGPLPEMQAAIAMVFDVAQALGLRAFDPQLGREVSRKDVPEILDRWKKAATFLGDVVGAYEDPRGYVPAGEKQAFLSTGTKIALLVLGAIAFGLWALDRTTASLAQSPVQATRPAAARPAGLRPMEAPPTAATPKPSIYGQAGPGTSQK